MRRPLVLFFSPDYINMLIYKMQGREKRKEGP
jgi:hypothetical protein